MDDDIVKRLIAAGVDEAKAKATERYLANLCDDEGCDYHGTPHMCIQMPTRLDVERMHHEMQELTQKIKDEPRSPSMWQDTAILAMQLTDRSLVILAAAHKVIADSQPMLAEFYKIAGMVGEEADPYSAWESIQLALDQAAKVPALEAKIKELSNEAAPKCD